MKKKKQFYIFEGYKSISKNILVRLSQGSVSFYNEIEWKNFIPFTMTYRISLISSYQLRIQYNIIQSTHKRHIPKWEIKNIINDLVRYYVGLWLTNLNCTSIEP